MHEKEYQKSKLKLKRFAFALIITVGAALLLEGSAFGGKNDSLIRKSPKEIKAYILVVTPLGTSSDLVLSAIKATLQIKSAKYKTNFDTFDRTLSHYKMIHVIGRIDASLGSIPGLFTMTDVDAQWDFDANNKLTNVTIYKQAVGP